MIQTSIKIDKAHSISIQVMGEVIYTTEAARATYTASVGSEVMIGGVCPASFSATIPMRDNLLDKIISVTLVFKDGRLPLGVFKVTECSLAEQSATFTAYDALYWATGGQYIPNVPASPTVNDILKDIAGKIGVKLSDVGVGANIAVSAPLTGYTLREMLGYMSALLGRNAVLGRDNKLRMAWFTGGANFTDYYTGGLQVSGDYYLAGIAAHVPTGEGKETILSVGEGSGMVIDISNPFMRQERLDAIWADIGGLSGQLGSLSVFCGIENEAGDIITVTDTSGNSNRILATSVTMELDGGAKCSVSAAGQSASETGAAFQGTMGKSITRLQADVAAVKQLTVRSESGETFVDGGKIKTGSVTAEKLDVTNLSALSANLSGFKIERRAAASSLPTFTATEDVVIDGDSIRLSDDSEVSITLSNDMTNRLHIEYTETTTVHPLESLITPVVSAFIVKINGIERYFFTHYDRFEEIEKSYVTSRRVSADVVIVPDNGRYAGIGWQEPAELDENTVQIIFVSRNEDEEVEVYIQAFPGSEITLDGFNVTTSVLMLNCKDFKTGENSIFISHEGISVGSDIALRQDGSVESKSLEVAGNANFGSAYVKTGDALFGAAIATPWVDIELAPGVTTNGKNFGGSPTGKPACQISGNSAGYICRIAGSVSVTIGTDVVAVGQLPPGIRPRANVYDFAPCGGVRIARINVSSGGTIRLEWIKNQDGSRFYGNIEWIQINMCFPLDPTSTEWMENFDKGGE